VDCCIESREGEEMKDCVHIDHQFLSVLRNAYLNAMNGGKKHSDVITIDGREYVLGYLRYLIEYAEGELYRGGNK
jgi:hypothetical protein